MGGEKRLLLGAGCKRLGSPPRGRGKADDAHIGSRAVGITPAWAGKSLLQAGAFFGVRDHPRVGGEKTECSSLCFCILGSPPRGRGKAIPQDPLPDQEGITPAWAGKRWVWCWPPPPLGDHPRVGGEKSDPGVVTNSIKGSPPRGRGKAYRAAGHCTRLGITPAWAGKRFLPRMRRPINRDHPRVGGEKDRKERFNQNPVGSPPRGRGKALEGVALSAAHGITPAWAGKRLKRSHRSGIFISGPIPFHSVLHRPAGSGGSRAGRDGSPAGQSQNTGPA